MYKTAASVLLLFLMPEVLGAVPASCNRLQPPWSPKHVLSAKTWIDGNKKVRPIDDLNELVASHKRWLAGIKFEGKPLIPGGDRCRRQDPADQGTSRLNLTGAILTNVDLHGLDLRCSILEGATFTEANLSGTDLSYTQLNGARFIGTDLTAAGLIGADLRDVKASDASFAWANLNASNLCRITIRGGELTQASFDHSCMLEATLNGSSLRHASLEEAVFGSPSEELGDGTPSDTEMACAELCPEELAGHSSFVDTDLSDALLMRAKGDRAIFGSANLTRANLRAARLNGADFEQACLSSVRAQQSSLSEVNFKLAGLNGAVLDQANLDGLIYEPETALAPRGIAFAEGLSHLSYDKTSEHVFSLQAELEAAGFGSAARKVRASISRKEATGMEKLLFGMTCDYRSAPIRPLMGVFFLLILASFAYLLSCFGKGPTGLYLIVPPPPDESHSGALKEETIRISFKKNGFWKAALWSSFYSAHCALTLGPENLNILGQLTALLPSREMKVVAHGWPRVVGGVQALVSVGLLVLMLASIAL